MDRAYDERNLLYFCKRARSSVILLLILSFGMGSVGYTKDGGEVFLVLAGAFALMALWQVLKVRIICVKGTEVDASAEKISSRVNLARNAQEALNLDKENVEPLQCIMLKGYTVQPIETIPLLRWDEDDQKARSSNWQMSLFFLDETIMFSYTEIHSLVDSEYADSNNIWRYASITECVLDTVTERCVVHSRRQEEKKEGSFNRLLIKGENGEAFAFAFDEQSREAAELLVTWICCKIRKKARLRKPGKVGKAEETHRERSKWLPQANLSRYEQKSLGIGFIGNRLDAIDVSSIGLKSKRENKTQCIPTEALNIDARKEENEGNEEKT